jgi:hypothetical protein
MSASERGGTRKDRKIELLGRALDFCGVSTVWLAVKR